MSDLEDFLKEASKQSPYIKFEDGEPVKGIFKGVKLVDDTFNIGTKTMEYTIEIDESDKTFKSKSVNLARMIKGVKEGQMVQIVKTGSGMKTIWYVEKVEK